MDRGELEQRVKSFPGWQYEIDLNGVRTPTYDAGLPNRQKERTRYFFDALVQLCGGSLKGKRVLDLGCNAGWWTLQALQAGADFVYALDGRAMHLEQSSLVLDVYGIEPSRYQLVEDNLYTHDYSAQGTFDIVLVLGLLYHVGKPLELFELISKVNSDIVVVDSLLSHRSGSAFELRQEPTDRPQNAVDYEIVFVPTRRAIVDLLGLFGYQSVVLRPDMVDRTGVEDYWLGYRRAVIGAKASDLRPLHADRLDISLHDRLADTKHLKRTAREYGAFVKAELAGRKEH